MVQCLLHKPCIVWEGQAILVVDDDEYLALMVANLLKEKGYQVWTARDGVQGYASYYQHQAQTVVTDIDMPELDGLEMMRCIRSINPSARAIYMSGTPERYRRTLLVETQNFGASVLKKPFEELDLLTLISSFPTKQAPHRYEWSTDQKKFVWKEAV